MTTYTIRPYDSGPAAHLYVIQQENLDVPELDRTLLALHSDRCGFLKHATCRQHYNTCLAEDDEPATCRREEQIRQLFNTLKASTQTEGFDIRNFRTENYTSPSRALHRGPIRVYGLRYDPTLFVAGGAALKMVAAIHHDKDVAREFYPVERARVALDQRLRSRPGLARDADGTPVLPKDEMGRSYLPDAVLHPF